MNTFFKQANFTIEKRRRLFIKGDRLVYAKERQASASSFGFAFRGRQSRCLKGRRGTRKTYLSCSETGSARTSTENKRKGRI